jgi:C_GCAxxG_C_C family probable redox protein
MTITDRKRKDLIMNNAERTVDLFSGGMTCAQAMLAVFGEAHGLNVDMVARLGRPLGGGMGRSGRTCGALTSAVLLLGLSKDDPDEAEARKACVHHVQQLFQRFIGIHGTTECSELLGADWNTAEGLRKIQEENLVKNLCPAFVKDAASILEELMTDSSCPAARVARPSVR